MDYDMQNDWLLVKTRRLIPNEIISFIEDVFQIIEIRGKVGNLRGITFEVRTKEKNHSVPHVHAKYGNHSISIDIENGIILAGNLPPSQQRQAKEWVKKNKSFLLGEWSNIAITATSITTKSRLD